MAVTRVQLSLFVPRKDSADLERVRLILDPVQSELIPAHVTLCREDELAHVGFHGLASRLSSGLAKQITLVFGKPCEFGSHGILLPCVEGQRDFQRLREHILGSSAIREHAPHITLAHPRNPKSVSNILVNAGVLAEKISITFESVNLIEQTGSLPWQILQSFDLRLR
jgi:2'-5' RNA ligase